MVRARLRYIVFIFFLLTGFSGFSQISRLPENVAVFGDSLRSILSATNNERAIVVGEEISSAWLSLSGQQQEAAASQIRVMLNKKFPVRPYLVTYSEALAAAVNVEHLDAQKLTAYLETAGQVIEREERSAVMTFLSTSSLMFREHKLFSENSNTLYALDASYNFEYITIPEYTEQEITDTEDPEEEEDEYFDDWDDEPSDDDWDTNWEDEDWEDDNWDDYEEENENSMAQAIATAEPLPLIEGAVIRFEKVTFNFATPYDSVFIENTSGALKITRNIFVGAEGRMTWESAGLPGSDVYAEFSEYSFDIRKPEVEAQNSTMHYAGKVTEGVPGIVNFKSIRHDSAHDASYPRFISYQSDVPVSGFGPDISYVGGFSMKGDKIISASVLGDLSTINVAVNDMPKFKARAKFFEFGDSIVSTQRAKVIVYQNEDSIYHPAVRMDYNMNSRDLVLQKDKGGYRNTPYSASYFNVDFTADLIRWNLDNDSLDISILEAKRMVSANFESVDHYNYEDYVALGDKLYDFNPLGIVAAYAAKEGTNEFYVSELARRYKKQDHIIKGAMLSLAQKGLIDFDAQSGRIKLKEKGEHLYQSKFGMKDFDNFIFASTVMDKPNATLNFPNGYMTVRGVEKFQVSDSLNVMIEPDSSTITLLENRDFKFDGKITAGNYEYYGRDFTFRYDSFLINLKEIDSIQFYIKDVNSRGGKGRRKINNSLVSDVDGATKGTLFINRPNNKSGKVSYNEYPKFDTGKGSIVFFDNKDVFGGVYERSINFVVPPFAVDSLNGSDPTSISFDGQFVSGIFPTFDATLEVMDDYSMGFEHTTTPEGLSLYGSNSTYYNDLKLDKNGLRGNGRIDHLSLTLESEDFIFYPDSVVSQAKTLVMREETVNGFTFPRAEISDFDMKWTPSEDSLVIENREEQFRFYDTFASLDGRASINSNGVFASGTVVARESVFESDEISFEHDQFDARHAVFNKLSDNPEKPLIRGTDVKLNFNLVDSTTTISPEVEGDAAIEFPYAQFNTSISEAKWDLQQDKIYMSKPENVALESSYFYTTREDLDSLSFYATHAEYDLNTLELKVSGIPSITVADALITPENGEVLILENSKIGTLMNTTIVLDTLNGYHTLTDGVIDIISRNEFSGYATYHFVNMLGDSVPVRFDNFRLEEVTIGKGRRAVTERHTTADGFVREDQDAMVAPGMFYKGGMTLYANKPALELEGYIKLDMNEPGYDTWIKHSSSGDDEKVVINFDDNVVTEDGRNVVSGLHISAGDQSLYNTFITQRYSPDDEDFFLAGGVLFYDEASEDFVVEDTAKASGNSLAGRIFRYNKFNGNIRFEGPAKFLPTVTDASFKSAVIGSGNINDNSYVMNAMLAVNFSTLPQQALEAMAADVLDVIINLGAPESLGDPTNLLYKLADVAGERAAREYEEASAGEYVSLGGFANETSVSLMFPNLDIKWSNDFNGFYNEGKIGLSNILRTDINGAFDGFLEMKRNEDGLPVFNLFLKASGASWYYFGYEDNRLLVYSSNELFNQIIAEKSNGAKAKIGELVFAPGDRAETLAFINRFRLQYYGIDEEYFLESEVDTVVDENEDGFGGKEEEDDGFGDEDDGF